MEAITLGPLAIPLSHLFLLSGLAVLFLSARWWERRRGIDLEKPLWGALITGLLAARAVFVAVHWDAYSNDPVSALYLWQDGYVPLAGVLAALAFAAFYAWRRGCSQRVLLSPLATGAAVFFGLTLLAGALATEHDLPEITLADLREQAVPLQQYSGKPVVVNLWATWCPPCRREMPMFQGAQQRHDDIHFVFVNQGETGSTIRDYLTTEELTLENVLLDQPGKVSGHFGAHGMPTTLFFDADGRLVDSHLGEISAARLAHYLRSLR